MTPERQKWWDSLSTEEKRVRRLIKTLKGNINCCKQTIADEWAAITNNSQNGKNQLKAAKDNLRDTKRAIKALRKQIAMRPWERIDVHSIHCPCCWTWIYANDYKPPCCDSCGQKLRWK